MAEFTGFRNCALPYPVYGLPWVVKFPLLDADGDPTSPSSPDSEVSKNGNTFTDCTNEAVEIASSSGVCYLSLTLSEMSADCVGVRIQSTGAKTTVLTLYPRKLPTVRSGTSASIGADVDNVILDSGASAVDDFYNGMLIAVDIDSVTEVRIIADYTGSTKTANVIPAWNTAPDSNDTFTIYLPEGVQIQQANVTHFGGATGTFSGGRPEVNTTHAAGTAWGSGAITAASIATGAIDADAIADNAIDAGAIASDAITSAKIADNAITAAKIANGAIDAATFAADVDAEILSYLVDDATRIDASALNTASGAIGSNGSGLTEAGGTGDHLTAVPWNAAWDAEVQSEVTDSLVAHNLDHLCLTATGGADMTSEVADNTILSRILANGDTSVFDPSTDGLQPIRDQIVTIDDFLDTEVTAILADTNELQTDWTDGGRLDLIIDAILVDTGTTLQGELDGIQADTEDIQSRLPAALVNSRMDCTIDATGMESGAVANVVAGVGLTLASGTIGSTGNSTTALHLTGLTYGDDELNDYLIVIRDVSESEYHARWIEDWASTGDLATVATLPFTPQNATDTYVILAIRQDVSGGSGLDAAGVRAALGFASASYDTDVAQLNTKLDTIDNLVDTEIGALTTELAKVPKSDSNVTWNATAAAQIQSEATDALNAYDPPTNAEMEARTLAAASYATASALDAVDNFIDTEITAIKGVTDKLDTALELDGAVYRYTTNALEQAPSGGGSLTAQQVWEYATRTLTAIDEDSTTLDLDATIRSAVGLASANLDTQLDAIPTVSEIWTTALTEAYASAGAAFTGAQALYEICQALTEFTISGTTITVKKRDHSTTAATFTLNDDEAPTSRTRAT